MPPLHTWCSDTPTRAVITTGRSSWPGTWGCSKRTAWRSTSAWCPAAPLGRMGTPPFLQAVANARLANGRIVASGVHGSLDHFFMAVSPDIQNLARLKGRTVGVLSRGSCVATCCA